MAAFKVRKLPTLHGIWLLVRFHLRGLGWPAMLGLGLAMASLATDFLLSEDLARQISQSRQEQRKLSARLAERNRQQEGDGMQQAQLPSQEATDPLINDIHSAARNNGVRLEQGEYRLQVESGTRLARYRIVLPAKGTYPQMRSWLDQITAAHAGLAVEELTMRREEINKEILDSRVTLALLLRGS